MRELRVAIIDDEPLVREGIRHLLGQVEGIRLVGEAHDGRRAVTLIQQERPDLIFLDVQMPEQDGFDVLGVLHHEPLPAVVFVTAHGGHAIRAFDHHAVDYLLKPFDSERFYLALDRARRRLDEPGDRSLKAVLEELRNAPRYLGRVLVKHEGMTSIVPVTEIDWIEASDNHVRLHTATARYLVRATIKTMEQQLDPGQFIRVHRSTIVNLSRVRKLQPLFGGEYQLRLSSGACLTLSRGYRDRFRAAAGSSAGRPPHAGGSPDRRG